MASTAQRQAAAREAKRQAKIAAKPVKHKESGIIFVGYLGDIFSASMDTKDIETNLACMADIFTVCNVNNTQQAYEVLSRCDNDAEIVNNAIHSLLIQKYEAFRSGYWCVNFMENGDLVIANLENRDKFDAVSKMTFEFFSNKKQKQERSGTAHQHEYAVREHLRHYKSGKVVTIKAHSRCVGR